MSIFGDIRKNICGLTTEERQEEDGKIAAVKIEPLLEQIRKEHFTSMDGWSESCGGVSVSGVRWRGYEIVATVCYGSWKDGKNIWFLMDPDVFLSGSVDVRLAAPMGDTVFKHVWEKYPPYLLEKFIHDSPPMVEARLKAERDSNRRKELKDHLGF